MKRNRSSIKKINKNHTKSTEGIQNEQIKINYSFYSTKMKWKRITERERNREMMRMSSERSSDDVVCV